MSFLRPKDEYSPQVNLIPFVDILAAVVTFLLLSTTFVGVKELKTSIGLPSTEAMTPLRSDYVTVVIKDEGRLVFHAHRDKHEWVDLLPTEKGRINFKGFHQFLSTLPREYNQVVLVPTSHTSLKIISRLTELAQKHSRAVVLSAEPQKGS